MLPKTEVATKRFATIKLFKGTHKRQKPVQGAVVPLHTTDIIATIATVDLDIYDYKTMHTITKLNTKT